MSYLNELLKNLEQVEDFLQVKSMFLILQILFELRYPATALPVINFLEVKLQEFQSII